MAVPFWAWPGRQAGAPGEEAASQAVLDHKAGSFLSPRTPARQRPGGSRLESDKLPVLTLPEKKSELGAAVGFVDVAAAAVCDLGFACAIAQKLAAEDENCRDAAERLKAPPVQSRAPEGGYCQARQEIGQTRQMARV